MLACCIYILYTAHTGDIALDTRQIQINIFLISLHKGCGYGKCPKFPYFYFLNFVSLIFSIMANNVDPDQIAPSGAV